ncbi:hypothetical protein QVD17_38371 [Tagetes erecta]|uniref:Uncharacterized protein n=1 Tax=Tagetes erecta TaxID=13708 RepID=A0AAD8JN21_TARER|nr:hypothetical protein QVD17_38371 [Tagetes erecta]
MVEVAGDGRRHRRLWWMLNGDVDGRDGESAEFVGCEGVRAKVLQITIPSQQLYINRFDDGIVTTLCTLYRLTLFHSSPSPGVRAICL